jgi:hypothetical protein
VSGSTPERAVERLDAASAAIIDAVERDLPGYLNLAARRILDAWNQLEPGERARVDEGLDEAARRATDRTVEALRELLARDASEQSATPLEVVRASVQEPTVVLQAAGVPPVVRDEFEERAWPADCYQLVPRTLADVGGVEVGALLLEWGLAKTAVLRSTRGRA